MALEIEVENIAEHLEPDLDVDVTTADAKAGHEDAIADFAEPLFMDETMNDLDEILDSQDTATEFPAPATPKKHRPTRMPT
ncbi:hypothetical protein [Rhodococcus erythropolis]